jgi:hypothetical protein
MVWRADSVPGAPVGVIRLRLTTYHGDPVRLGDGTMVADGDRIGEIHLNNRVLSQLTVGSRWRIIGPIREDLRALARWVRSSEFPAEVRAFYGQTLIGRTVRIVGFEVFPRPVTMSQRFERIYMQGLLQIYSHEGVDRLTHGKARVDYPFDVWMSRATLLRLYGNANEPAGGAPGRI